MANLAVLFGMAAALCWGSSDYLSRRQSSRIGSYRTVLYSHLATLAVVVALVPLLRPSLSVTPAAALVLSVAAVVNLAAFVLLYRAFHAGAVSIVAPIAYTFPAVTVVLSVLLLETRISAISGLAIAWIIGGVVLLSMRVSDLRKPTSGKRSSALMAGVGSAVGSSVFFGAAYVGVGYAIPLVGYVVPIIILRGIAALVGFMIAPLIGQAVGPSRAALSVTIATMGVLEALGFLAFTYGVSASAGSLPIVAAVSGVGGAVATIYGLMFLRERLELNQIVGIVLAVSGVFVLLYLGG